MPLSSASTVPRGRSPAYLLPRPSGYYFRYTIPPALRPLLGLRELRQALGTASLIEARRKARRLAARAEGFCAWVSREREQGMLPENLRDVLRAYLKDCEREVAEWIIDRPPTPEYVSESATECSILEDAPEEPLSDQEADLREALYRNDLQRVAPEAAELLAAAGLAIDQGSTEFLAFCREILKAQIMAYERGRGVARQGLASEPLSLTWEHSKPTKDNSTSSTADNAPRFSELVERYMRSKDGITEKSQRKYRAVLGLWVEAMGDPPLMTLLSTKTPSALRGKS